MGNTGEKVERPPIWVMRQGESPKFTIALSTVLLKAFHAVLTGVFPFFLQLAAISLNTTRLKAIAISSHAAVPRKLHPPLPSNRSSDMQGSLMRRLFFRTFLLSPKHWECRLRWSTKRAPISPSLCSRQTTDNTKK